MATGKNNPTADPLAARMRLKNRLIRAEIALMRVRQAKDRTGLLDLLEPAEKDLSELLNEIHTYMQEKGD